MKSSADTSYVVGIGASAHGLAALKRFFGSFREAPDLAFVVIQHLAPEQSSSLKEILQSTSELPVTAAEDGVAIEAGHIYVIGPGDQLTIEDRVLKTASLPDLDAERHTIDTFFDSLAADCGDHSVGMLVSGAGQDGTAGLRSIKEHGGITMAQDPEEAGIVTMPQTAIQSGVVDVIGSVDDLHKRLISIIQSSPKFEDGPRETDSARAQDAALGAVLDLLRRRTGNTFSEYKRPTILRRIGRRMQIRGLETLDDYLSWLQDDADEVDALFDELLIKVTQFFRDPEIWNTVEETIIPEIFAGKGRDDQVRVWVPGCATGEEAYTVAMLLSEHARSLDERPEIKVFATDISHEAIRIARRGSYPASIATDIRQDRLDRFFHVEAGQYTVGKEVRNRVLFAPQNALTDPPFSNLDLVSCRNLLIYLRPPAQERLLKLFHYALDPGGYLMLGPSETPSPAAELFEDADSEAHIYQARRGVDSSVALAGPGFGFEVSTELGETQPSIEPAKLSADLERVHRKAVFDNHEFTSVLVDSEHRLLHTTGDVSPYLSVPSGRATDDLLKMVDPRLRAAVRTTIFEAIHLRDGTVSRRVDEERDAELPSVRVQAALTTHPEFEGPLIAVSFLREPELQMRDSMDLSEDEVIAQYERELEQARRDLQRTVEEYEESNQKLRASNEELMSMNEELQSTTEELETSKEELQSMNEELQTVNDELNEKIRELDSVNSDLRNLMRSTDIGTIFLDRDLTIKRFTDPATDYFNLLPSDHERPLDHVTHTLEADDLADDAQRVLDEVTTIEREVSTQDDHHLLVRALPYLTTDDRIDGVVLTFVDITERQRIKDRLAESEKKFRTVFESAVDPMFIYQIDEDGSPSTILDANGSALGITGLSRDSLGEASLDELLSGPDFSFLEYLETVEPKSRSKAEARLDLGTDRNGLHAEIQTTLISLDARTLAVTVVRDITHQKAYEEALIESKDRAEKLAELRSMFLSTLSHDVRSPLTTIMTIASVLQKETAGEHLEMLDRIQRAAEQLRTILDSILRMAELETNEVSAQPEAFDLVYKVDEVLDLHESVAERRGLVLEYDGPDRCDVRLDSRFITQILNNLVDNAIKYTDEGRIELRVSADETFVRLEVEDTGAGIPPEQQELVFDWFERGTDNPTGELGSVGLGLAITKLLVEAMDGSVAVESEPGEGSTFLVTVPRQLDAQSDASPVAPVN